MAVLACSTDRVIDKNRTGLKYWGSQSEAQTYRVTDKNRTDLNTGDLRVRSINLQSNR
jgi:hypothetical protein